ncbi:hypothetical protein JL721_3750 [Aureococcus anophagefferens]|nr:hypothetical protein JL721_3750 [Aureococcus anophagefferens]
MGRLVWAAAALAAARAAPTLAPSRTPAPTAAPSPDATCASICAAASCDAYNAKYCELAASAHGCDCDGCRCAGATAAPSWACAGTCAGLFCSSYDAATCGLARGAGCGCDGCACDDDDDTSAAPPPFLVAVIAVLAVLAVLLPLGAYAFATERAAAAKCPREPPPKDVELGHLPDMSEAKVPEEIFLLPAAGRKERKSSFASDASAAQLAKERRPSLSDVLGVPPRGRVECEDGRLVADDAADAPGLDDANAPLATLSDAGLRRLCETLGLDAAGPRDALLAAAVAAAPLRPVDAVADAPAMLWFAPDLAAAPDDADEPAAEAPPRAAPAPPEGPPPEPSSIHEMSVKQLKRMSLTLNVNLTGCFEKAEMADDDGGAAPPSPARADEEDAFPPEEASAPPVMTMMDNDEDEVQQSAVPDDDAEPSAPPAMTMMANDDDDDDDVQEREAPDDEAAALAPDDDEAAAPAPDDGEEPAAAPLLEKPRPSVHGPRGDLCGNQIFNPTSMRVAVASGALGRLALFSSGGAARKRGGGKQRSASLPSAGDVPQVFYHEELGGAPPANWAPLHAAGGGGDDEPAEAAAEPRAGKPRRSLSGRVLQALSTTPKRAKSRTSSLSSRGSASSQDDAESAAPPSEVSSLTDDAAEYRRQIERRHSKNLELRKARLPMTPPTAPPPDGDGPRRTRRRPRPSRPARAASADAAERRERSAAEAAHARAIVDGERSAAEDPRVATAARAVADARDRAAEDPRGVAGRKVVRSPPAPPDDAARRDRGRSPGAALEVSARAERVRRSINAKAAATAKAKPGLERKPSARAERIKRAISMSVDSNVEFKRAVAAADAEDERLRALSPEDRAREDSKLAAAKARLAASPITRVISMEEPASPETPDAARGPAEARKTSAAKVPWAPASSPPPNEASPSPVSTRPEVWHDDDDEDPREDPRAARRPPPVATGSDGDHMVELSVLMEDGGAPSFVMPVPDPSSPRPMDLPPPPRPPLPVSTKKPRRLSKFAPSKPASPDPLENKKTEKVQYSEVVDF